MHEFIWFGLFVLSHRRRPNDETLFCKDESFGAIRGKRFIWRKKPAKIEEFAVWVWKRGQKLVYKCSSGSVLASSFVGRTNYLWVGGQMNWWPVCVEGAFCPHKALLLCASRVLSVKWLLSWLLGVEFLRRFASVFKTPNLVISRLSSFSSQRNLTFCLLFVRRGIHFVQKNSYCWKQLLLLSAISPLLVYLLWTVHWGIAWFWNFSCKHCFFDVASVKSDGSGIWMTSCLAILHWLKKQVQRTKNNPVYLLFPYLTFLLMNHNKLLICRCKLKLEHYINLFQKCCFYCKKILDLNNLFPKIMRIKLQKWRIFIETEINNNL